MVKRLVLVVALCAVALPARAQILATGDLNVLNAVVVVSPGTGPAVALGVTGTFSGTITFQCSVDGGNFNSMLATNLTDGSAVTTTTATGAWSVANAGCLAVQVKMTAYSSGSAHITVTRGYWNARLFNPLFGLGTFTVNALGATSTDGVVIQNTTASTGGTTAQYSPRIKWCGTAWNSSGSASEVDCFAMEVRPVTNAGTTSMGLTFLSSVAGGAYANLGNLFSTGVFSQQAFSTANSSYYEWSGRSRMFSPVDGLINFDNNSQTFGPQFNTGTAAPTATTCGTGAVTAHSSNTAGEVTATGATTCTLTFGAPNFTNKPFCSVTEETTVAALRISAVSASAFTVTGLTSNDVFSYVCFGGV